MACLALLIILLLYYFCFSSDQSASSQPFADDSPIRARTPGKVRDCRSWLEQEYTQQTDPPDVVAKIKQAEEITSAPTQVETSADEERSNETVTTTTSTTTTTTEPPVLLEHSDNLRQALSKIIAQLKKVLKKNQIRLLDAQCGDMTWMSVFLKGRKDIHYTGFDYAFEKTDAAKLASPDELWYFRQFDVVNERIRGDYDLVIIRDGSTQLSRSDSVMLFLNLIASGSRYLVTSTFPTLQFNAHVGQGRRRQNLELFPFHFPPPICITSGSPVVEGEHVALWRIADLSAFMEENMDSTL